jgi:hypothetical protein
VVLVDVEVALRANDEIECAVACDEIQHVIEKTNARLVVETSCAIDVQAETDLRLACHALDYRFAHSASSASTALSVCSMTPAVIRKQPGVYGSRVRSRTSTPRSIMPSINARAPVPPSTSTKFAALFQ